MDARREINVDKILVKFLGEIAHWNQTTAAKLLGIDRRRFNDYYNHRREIPNQVLLKIESILQANGIYLDPYKSNKSLCFTQKLPHSERAKQVLADKRWRKRRRGRPKSAEKINWHRDDNLMEKNRIDDRLAKEWGFSSRFTMRVAVLVVEKGDIDLIEALDQDVVSFKCAEKLVQLPKTLQRELVMQGREAILAYFKKSEAVTSSGKADITTALKMAKEHPRLMPLDREKYQLFQTVFEEILYAASC